MENNKMNYETSNMYEAAFCLAKGCRLDGKRTDKSGRRTVFIFSDANSKDIGQSYYNGAVIEANALMDAYRTLKDYAFDIKN
jgi:hypothetical protein